MGSCDEGIRIQEDARACISEFLGSFEHFDTFPTPVFRSYVLGMISICWPEQARVYFDLSKRAAVRHWECNRDVC